MRRWPRRTSCGSRIGYIPPSFFDYLEYLQRVHFFANFFCRFFCGRIYVISIGKWNMFYSKCMELIFDISNWLFFWKCFIFEILGVIKFQTFPFISLSTSIQQRENFEMFAKLSSCTGTRERERARARINKQVPWSHIRCDFFIIFVVSSLTTLFIDFLLFTVGQNGKKNSEKKPSYHSLSHERGSERSEQASERNE